VSVRDFDPEKAPTKTAQDLLDWLKRWADMNDRKSFGFTKKDLQESSRSCFLRVKCILDKALFVGHIEEKNGRYYVRPSFAALSFGELMGPAEVYTEKRNDGTFQIRCSWCGVSTTKWATRQGALDRLERTNHHANRKSHSLERSTVNG
jgi:hypothetical protein